MKLQKGFFLLSIVAMALGHAATSQAAGMVPETSLLIINEADQSGSINIKNTDDKP